MQTLIKPSLYKGVFIASTVISLWLIAIVLGMNFNINFLSPWVYVFVLLQMHLYTGLFITAHDAMHGIVMPHKPKINFIIGQLCTALYAVFPFKKLKTKHFEHHNFVHTAQDPDYYQGNFFAWYFSFIRQYISWWQILIMAILFNILKIYIPQQNLLLFWVLPSLLSTLQLFYFGTYLPHKGHHSNIYQSTSQAKNHFVAFFTCYFFGYHYEHHHSPATPWWLLWKIKEQHLHTNTKP
ncbi:MAG: fatty acid desaturase [Sphingobacteriales bacterium]|jgi:beta-carotene ketolase (CrtW type)|nr:MAG: fatty acid desaturase [Sphingobacteriales bacterium]